MNQIIGLGIKTLSAVEVSRAISVLGGARKWFLISVGLTIAYDEL